MKITTWVLFIIAVVLVVATYYFHQDWEHPVKAKSPTQEVKTK